jgi:phosphoglycolate phosphatase-like HAD superfamily hydrolase
MAAAFARVFGRCDRVAGVPFAGRTDRVIAADLLASHGHPDTDDNWHAFRAAYLEELPRALAASPGTVLPGVTEALARLAGRPVGLLTGNVRAGADAKLGWFGLRTRFAFGGFGDERRCRNDVARDALAAARTAVGAELDPRSVWVLGDTPLDIACARAIGARVVAVATGQHTLADLAADRPDKLYPTLADALADRDVFPA